MIHTRLWLNYQRNRCCMFFVFQPSNWVLMTMTQPQMYTIYKYDIYIYMYMYYTHILYCIWITFVEADFMISLNPVYPNNWMISPSESAVKIYEIHGTTPSLEGKSLHGYLQIINFNRVFHCKPSILGYPYFWKHPHINMEGTINRVIFSWCGTISFPQLGTWPMGLGSRVSYMASRNINEGLWMQPCPKSRRWPQVHMLRWGSTQWCHSAALLPVEERGNVVRLMAEILHQLIW